MNYPKEAVPVTMLEDCHGVVCGEADIGVPESDPTFSPAAIERAVFDEMTKLDQAWNSYGRSRESAVRFALRAVANLQRTAGVATAPTNTRLLHLADIGATVLIEAHARRVQVSPPIYDINTPDEEEMPSGKELAEMAFDLAVSAAHLTERGLLVRPVEGKPELVSFAGRGK